MALDLIISLFPWLIALSALTLSINLFQKFKKGGSYSKLKLPPGPPGLPLVGNMFELGQVPHQQFHNLQAKYGPIVRLKIGAVNTVVVQSAEAAAELIKKHDVPFADRKVPDSLTALDYYQGSIALGSYREYWRRVRRICTIEFLVHKRVNASMPIRQKCMVDMIERIKEDSSRSKMSGGSGEIELKVNLFVTSFNIIGNMILSREVMDAKKEKARDFFDAFVMFLDWLVKPNLADYLPLLKWLDPQRIRKNTEKYLEKLIGFASEIVHERIQEKQSGKVKESHDLLDALLDDGDDVNAQGTDKLSVKNITIVLLEMFFGGTETTSGTIEWGMTELMRNPSAMKKIRDEIDRVVGRTRMVEETDLNDMPYLQATVKEILRMYPTIPMMLPRRATEDTKFMGYLVPKDTQVFINAWAIHRDPSLWPDPFAFKPERFLDSEVDYKGQHFQMLPFGAGRRSCLGMTLGHRMVALSMASLVQAFDWKLTGGETPETVDMREMMGLTLRKMVPLKVIPVPRA